MRRLLVPAVLVLAACAPPLTRPIAAPLPFGYGQDVAQAGPEGESPAPMGGPSSVPIPVAAPKPVASVPAAIPMSAAIGLFRDRHPIIPVAGVGPEHIENTFGDDRDGGDRKHNAIDILAPRNTPILSADDGVILKMSSNTLGGITIYARDPAQTLVYYYAHLDHYNPRVTVGQKIARGDTLGFVGTTGNAPKDIPHLHFQVMLWPADGKYWIGEPINPYAVLREVGGGARSTPRFD